MRLIATHAPFLQSSAKLLILPLSLDGTISHSILLRAASLYPSNHSAYQAAIKEGNLRLGDAWIHRLQRQTAGLGIGSNYGATHIANLITTTHAYHSTCGSTLTQVLQTLKPELYKLIRYQGLRRAALLATPTLLAPDELEQPIDTSHLWHCLTEHLNVSRFQLDIHLPNAHLINTTKANIS